MCQGGGTLENGGAMNTLEGEGSEIRGLYMGEFDGVFSFFLVSLLVAMVREGKY